MKLRKPKYYKTLGLAERAIKLIHIKPFIMYSMAVNVNGFDVYVIAATGRKGTTFIRCADRVFRNREKVAI